MSLCKVIDSLQEIFKKYAGKEGDPNTLTKAELGNLLKAEYMLPPNTNQAKVDEFFSMLDGDMDGVVDFQEYVTFVGAIATVCSKK